MGCAAAIVGAWRKDWEIMEAMALGPPPGDHSWPCPASSCHAVVKVKVTQSCLTLCNPMEYTVHGILQARIMEWIAFPFTRGSSQPKDWTHISKSPALAARFFTTSTTWEAHSILQLHGNPLFLPHDQPVSRVSEWVSESCSVMSDSLQPHGIYNSWNSPVQNTRVGNLSLLQWIFPTQDWTMREALFLRYTHVISNLLF